MEIKTADFITSMADYGDFPGKGLPQIAVAGKSNVGKSTLINRLCRRNKLARTSATPGKTRLLNIFRINDTFHLVDLPGYGFAKVSDAVSRSWGRLIEGYLQEKSGDISLGILVMDIRRTPAADDEMMAKYFYDSGIPFLVVANKCDKLGKKELPVQEELFKAFANKFGAGCVIFSCLNRTGKEQLLREIFAAVKQ